ncbi:MAG TPA: flagellar hook protein FlgE [Bryobacteraceae bacterium]|jgi:flagellar hook protein FlgE|nr:flagellar hook protein FlgE [Bryobacteraceae bacterium]
MGSAISNALSGLTANATAINIVSNNLANLNTTGYKNEQISFEDLVNQSLSGIASSTSVNGSTIARGTQQFTQGSVQTTGNPYDAAIQGGGFFVLQDSNGQTLYTRQGNFSVNSSGDLVNSTGQFVQGWNAAAGVLNTNGPTGAIQLPNGLAQPPVATKNFTLSVNLASNATPGTPAGTFSSPMQIIDSQGNSHTLTVSYTETGVNTWSFGVTIPQSDIGVGVSNTVGAGTLTFDANGQLLSPDVSGSAIPITIPTLNSTGAAMNLNWNLYTPAGAAQIAQDTSTSANLSNTQDGLAAGQLSNMSIQSNGQIIATFSNGQTESVAQIAVASVLNPSSMHQFDGNSFVPTALTAPPVIGVPSTGSRGDVTGGALESSTVDIATEFTNLLTFERGYQANSKVITTEDQVVQQTIALIPGA